MFCFTVDLSTFGEFIWPQMQNRTNHARHRNLHHLRSSLGHPISHNWSWENRRSILNYWLSDGWDLVREFKRDHSNPNIVYQFQIRVLPIPICLWNSDQSILFLDRVGYYRDFEIGRIPFDTLLGLYKLLESIDQPKDIGSRGAKNPYSIVVSNSNYLWVFLWLLLATEMDKF